MSSPDMSLDNLLELAEAALDEGHPETTIELCRQVRTTTPTEVDAWYLEAEALRDLGALSAAEEAYRSALRLDPQHGGALAGLGSVLFDLRRYDASREAIQRAVRVDPEMPDAWYTRALLRERRGDTDGARRDYLRAARFGSPLGVPHELSDQQISELVHAAADLVEDETVTAWVATMPLHIADIPDDEACERSAMWTSPAELIGHLGLPHPSAGAQGPAILLYRRNLGRFAGDRDDLLAAVVDQVIEPVRDWIDARTIEA